MKKFFILSLVAMMFVGLTACGGEGTDSTSGDANADNATTTTTTDANANANPNDANANPAGNDNNAAPALPATTVEFSEMKHDFGKITQGEKVQHTFKFTNTGDNPLKIENVKPSCGCTTPDWTKEEVPPGADGIIKVEFDSNGKKGQQTKTVNVTLNTAERNTVLTFTGEVVVPGE